MRIRYAGRMWEVYLSDDGTLDTLVSVRPVTYRNGDNPLHTHNGATPDEGFSMQVATANNWHCSRCGVNAETAATKPCTRVTYPWQDERFSAEFAAEYRRPNGEMTMRGLRILGQEAAEAYDTVEIQ